MLAYVIFKFQGRFLNFIEYRLILFGRWQIFISNSIKRGKLAIIIVPPKGILLNDPHRAGQL